MLQLYSLKLIVKQSYGKMCTHAPIKTYDAVQFYSVQYSLSQLLLPQGGSTAGSSVHFNCIFDKTCLIFHPQPWAWFCWSFLPVKMEFFLSTLTKCLYIGGWLTIEVFSEVLSLQYRVPWGERHCELGLCKYIWIELAYIKHQPSWHNPKGDLCFWLKLDQ